MSRVTRHFYGVCAILFGAWETAAYLRLAPTLTALARKYPKFRPLIASWLLGLGIHLFKRP